MKYFMNEKLIQKCIGFFMLSIAYHKRNIMPYKYNRAEKISICYCLILVL